MINSTYYFGTQKVELSNRNRLKKRYPWIHGKTFCTPPKSNNHYRQYLCRQRQMQKRCHQPSACFDWYYFNEHGRPIAKKLKWMVQDAWKQFYIYRGYNKRTTWTVFTDSMSDRQKGQRKITRKVRLGTISFVKTMMKMNHVIERQMKISGLRALFKRIQ